MQTLTDFGEAVKEGRIAGVVQRMGSVGQHVTSKPPVHIPDDPRAPVIRRRVRNCESTDLNLVPPFHLDDVLEAQVENDIPDILRDNKQWPATRLPKGRPRNGS